MRESCGAPDLCSGSPCATGTGIVPLELWSVSCPRSARTLSYSLLRIPYRNDLGYFCNICCVRDSKPIHLQRAVGCLHSFRTRPDHKCLHELHLLGHQPTQRHFNDLSHRAIYRYPVGYRGSALWSQGRYLATVHHLSLDTIPHRFVP